MNPTLAFWHEYPGYTPEPNLKPKVSTLPVILGIFLGCLFVLVLLIQKKKN